jgi:hypothetical protein
VAQNYGKKICGQRLFVFVGGVGGNDMSLLLLVILLFFLFGGGFWGYRNYGPNGGVSIGGIVLLVLILYLLFGFNGGCYRHAITIGQLIPALKHLV